jgi:tRNA G10  N-methylase Trm11
MPLYCEDWLLRLGSDILGQELPSVLNVFCGMNKAGYRVDLNPDVKPNLICDVHKLTSLLPKTKFDIILADPPYSDEETDKLYGEHLPRLNYSVWTKECDKYLREGGLFIIYHKFLVPNPDPTKYEVVKRVAVFNRVWHLPRVAVYFRKKQENST